MTMRRVATVMILLITMAMTMTTTKWGSLVWTNSCASSIHSSRILPRNRPSAKIPDLIKSAKGNMFTPPFCFYTVRMRTRLIRLDAFRRRDSMLRTMKKLAPWARGLACLAVLAVVPFTAGVSHAMQSPTQGRDVINWPPMNPLANPTADANRYLEDSMKRQDNRKLLEKLNIQRQKEMASETEKLLALSNQLKADMD